MTFKFFKKWLYERKYESVEFKYVYECENEHVECKCESVYEGF